MSKHRPYELCDCPNPRPGRPFHCAAEAERAGKPMGSPEYRPYPDDRDELLGRLKAAEQVCVLVGWTAALSETEEQQAVAQAWSLWFSFYGTGSPTPEWRERIGMLAADYRLRRDEALARYKSERRDTNG